MSLLALPNRWTKKPDYQVSIDRNSPHAQGLTAAWLFNNSWCDTSNQYPATKTGAGLAISGERINPHTATSDNTLLTPANQAGTALLCATQGGTYIVRYRKRDSTNRAGGLFGAVSATSADRCGAHGPFSDGIVYWDFGGAGVGSTRLTVSGQTFELATWAFTTGPRGMEIWKNGRRIASNSANPTRTNGATTGLSLGRHANTSTSDLVDYSLFYAYRGVQLPTNILQELTLNPYLVLQAPNRRLWATAIVPVIISPDAGTLTATGEQPDIIAPKEIAIPAGSLTISSDAPVTGVSYVLSPNSGSINIASDAPSAVPGVVALPDAQNLVISGASPSVAVSYVLSPDTGAVSVSGQILVPVISISYEIGAGSVAFSGQSPVVDISYNITVPAGSFAFSGFAPNNGVSYVFVPDTGNLTTAGYAPVSNVSYAIGVPAGSLSVPGAAPTLNVSYTIDVATGALTITGAVPSDEISYSFEVPAGTLTAAGQMPVVSHGFNIGTPVGNIFATGLAASSELSYTFGVPAGAIVSEGFAPFWSQSYVIPVPAGSLVFAAGAAPFEQGHPKRTWKNAAKPALWKAAKISVRA